MSGWAFSIRRAAARSGVFVDLFGEQAALVETDVARRRADQALTAWRSMYSDMSKRTSSMPSV